MTLRSRDLQAVLSFVSDAHDADGPEALNVDLLDRLAELVGCEYATYQTFDWRRRVVTAYVASSNESEIGPCSLDRPESFWTASNPPHWTGAPFRKLSDDCNRRERERMRDAGEPDPDFAVVDMLGFRAGDRRTRSAWLCFDSWQRDFGERERELALALRPHVETLWRKTIARRQLAELTATLEREGDTAGGRAIVVLDADGRIGHATTEARTLLGKWFGRHDGLLPNALDEWLAQPPIGDRYTARRNGSALSIEAVGELTLILRERSVGVRLTPREREILGLVASGLTNAEVARRLWVAESTVAKHLEQAYAKLGVHNRTAAVARLAQLSD